MFYVIPPVLLCPLVLLGDASSGTTFLTCPTLVASSLSVLHSSHCSVPLHPGFVHSYHIEFSSYLNSRLVRHVFYDNHIVGMATHRCLKFWMVIVCNFLLIILAFNCYILLSLFISPDWDIHSYYLIFTLYILCIFSTSPQTSLSHWMWLWSKLFTFVIYIYLHTKLFL